MIATIVSSLFLLASASAAATGDVHLIIYETDVDLKSILSEQAAAIPGITATIVGRGTKFEGFGSKYEAVIPELRRLDANTLVVLSDARDVLINDPISGLYSRVGAVSKAVQELHATFDVLTSQYPGAIVASAEAQCCVGALTYAKPGDYFTESGDRNERACYSGKAPCLWNGDDKAEPWDNFMKDLAMQRMGHGEDVYLNAGLIAGKAGDMLRVFETADFQVFEDDQAVLTDFMYRRPDELILDYNQAIFGNNRHSTSECMFQRENSDKRLVHAETQTTPFFIHSPGGYVTCHESLAMRLGVKLAGAEQRRKLQDWKRKMQNYPPVCDYQCPPNSKVKTRVVCLDTFDDCKCDPGFNIRTAQETCEQTPCDQYTCPANSAPRSNIICLDSFEDCRCHPGFFSDLKLGQCVTSPPCGHYVCPVNSTIKTHIKCLDSFEDCLCGANFSPNFKKQTCEPIVFQI